MDKKLEDVSPELIRLLLWAYNDPDSEILGEDWNNETKALLTSLGLELDYE